MGPQSAKKLPTGLQVDREGLAGVLGCSVRTVAAMADEGLPAQKVNGRWMYDLGVSISFWVERQSAKVTHPVIDAADRLPGGTASR